MYASEWKARCPNSKKDEFIEYLHETRVKDASSTHGFLGDQIFSRLLDGKSEVTLISYWESLELIKAFSGEEISVQNFILRISNIIWNQIIS